MADLGEKSRIEMGKPSLKKKRGSASGGGGGGKPAALERSGSKVLDGDEAVFTEMAQELKEEGNKLFQRRDYESALLNYEKAIKLLPEAHPDVAYLHSNLAACYMQMSPPRPLPRHQRVQRRARRLAQV